MINHVRRALFFLLAMYLGVHVQAAVVLQYHHISEDTPAITSTRPELFAKHMEYLSENGFNVISMDKLLSALKSKKPLPDKTVAITFDDGYISIFQEAWPILEDKGWPFTVFINIEPHDHKNASYMSWNQLKEMADGGATIGNHSVSHLHMIRQGEGEGERAWLRRLRGEVKDAQRRIDDQLGTQLKVFAYPYGEYNREVQGVLKKLGYAAFGQQSGPIAPFSEVTALPRFPFGGEYGEMDDFIIKVGTRPMPLSRVTSFEQTGTALKDEVLPPGERQPELRLYSDDNTLLRSVQCFASRQGSATTTLQEGYLSVQAKQPLHSGRSRYNCTASAGDGRFYWFTKAWIIKPESGWYNE